MDDFKELAYSLGILHEEEKLVMCGICECGNWDHDHALVDGEWRGCLAINLRTGISCLCDVYKKWMGGEKCAEI